MRNNNQAIVRKITIRAMRSNKKRNLFVIIAIVLTAFMIASVFSLGMSYFESLHMRALRTQGSTSHFAFFHPTEEQMDEIFQLDYVRHVGVGVGVGTIDSFPQLGFLPLVHVNEVHWDEMFLPTFTNPVGTYAQADNEVMISRHTLNLMGIVEPEIGMEIPLTFAHFITGEVFTDVFVLSKIFTDFTHVGASPMHRSIGIYTSFAVAERFGVDILENTSINVIFRNSNQVARSAERLIYDLSIPAHENQEYAFAPAFEGNLGRASVYLGFAAITAFLMLAGYLLIYNVMYMSVSRDVRFFGLLKTVGMTAKQIRRIIIGQSLRLCVIGVPLGLVAAALISFIIVPLYIEAGGEMDAVISFSPLIYLGGAVFTIMTVYLASLTPAVKAAKVSPIESSRFIGENQSAKTYKSNINSKPVKMAMRNMFRESKRAKLTILSLFISIAVFTSAASLTSSIDVDYAVNQMYFYDFTIVSSRRAGELSRESADKFIEHFGDRAHVSMLTNGEFIYTDAISRHVDFISERDGKPRDEVISLLFDYYHFGLKSVDIPTLVEVTDSLIPHVNAEIIANVLTAENIEAFKRGELSFFLTRGFDSWLERENRLILDESRIDTFTIGSTLHMYIGPDKIPAQIEFGGFVNLRTPPYGQSLHYGTPEILVSNTFFEKYISPEYEGNFASTYILSINIDATTADEEQYYLVLNSMLDPEEQMFSRIAERRSYEEAMDMIFILGGGLAGILAFIGVFNFINVISASVVSRKREFAILESVGMSKKQMRKIIRYEGFGYLAITILLSATVGNLIAYALIWFISRMDSAFSFTYPFAPVLTIYAVILAICLIVPDIVYRSMSKTTLVERLRETE